MANHKFLASAADTAFAPAERQLNFRSVSVAHIFLVFAGLMLVCSLSLADSPPKPPILCIDGASNCGVVVAPASSGGRVKWHPGHYAMVPLSSSWTLDAGSQAKRFAIYDSIGTNRDFEGVIVYFRWAQLERPRGDYTPGIALIRNELNKLKSLPVPKRLILAINDSAYSGEVPDPCGLGGIDDFFPPWMTTSNGNLFSGRNACVWARWRDSTMGEYIKMHRALAAAFDDEPYLEMVIPFHETATNFGSKTPPADYTEAALDTQYRRLAKAMKEAWNTTLVSFPTNWGLNGDRMLNFIDYLATLGVGVGNPDTHPPQGQPVDRMINGSYDASGEDYRGVVPIAQQIEASGLGDKSQGDYTIQQIMDFAKSQRVTHMRWFYNTYTGVNNPDPRFGQRWSTILNAVAAEPIRATACPSSIQANGGCNAN